MRMPAESCPRLYTPWLYPRTQKSHAFRVIALRLHRHIAMPQPELKEKSLS